MKTSKELLEEIEALIADKFKDNPEELKRLTKVEKSSAKKEKGKKVRSEAEIERATKDLFEELKKANPNLSHIQSLIMEDGADVNSMMEDKGATPLFVASASDNEELIRVLVKSGAKVNFQNKQGVTALQTAVVNENVNAVKVLIELGADVNLKNEIGYTPLHLGAEGDEIEIVRMLIEAGANLHATEGVEGGTPLHRVVSNQAQGNVEIAKLLISYGADVNFQNADQSAPLHWACGNNKLTLVKILVEAGADVNIRGVQGTTPLVWALKREHPKVAKYIAKMGGGM